MFLEEAFMDKEIIKQNLQMKELLKFVRDIWKEWEKDDQDLASNLKMSLKEYKDLFGLDWDSVKSHKKEELQNILHDRLTKTRCLKKLKELTNIYIDPEDERDLEAKRGWKKIKEDLITWLKGL